MATITIWHDVAVDGQGHPTGMLDGARSSTGRIRNRPMFASSGTTPLPLAPLAVRTQARAR
jgi:hypothetical protein